MLYLLTESLNNPSSSSLGRPGHHVIAQHTSCKLANSNRAEWMNWWNMSSLKEKCKYFFLLTTTTLLSHTRHAAPHWMDQMTVCISIIHPKLARSRGTSTLNSISQQSPPPHFQNVPLWNIPKTNQHNQQFIPHHNHHPIPSRSLDQFSPL